MSPNAPTATYVAFLRGINVGGHKKVAMADLREIMGSLGSTNVSTLLNSGNAVFDAPVRPVTEHAGALQGAIKTRLGIDVRVIVRTPEDLARVLAANPIPDALDDPSHYLVGFLAAPVPTERVPAIDSPEDAREVIRLGDGAVYLWYRDGIGRSKLTIDVLERRLGTVTTARNWTTVTKLAALAAR
jgi:uncharacterized protein (DUF1697 family)